MAKMTLTEITEKLTAAKAEGRIWNVEFTDLRDKFGRRLDEAVKGIQDEVRAILQAAGLDRSEAFRLSGDFICTNYTNLKGRVDRLEKALRMEGYLPHVTEQVTKFRALQPVCDLVREVKGMVVKGRKPTERLVNIRTIENTGTCGCCGRNIKLSNAGRIVDHGYGIANRGYGYGTGYKTGGSCFGFHYEPIEVSPKVWQDMLAAMQDRLAKLPAILQSAEEAFAAMPKPTFPTFPTQESKAALREYHAAQRGVQDLRHELERLPLNIEDLTEKLAAWAPKPLPGTKW